MPTSSPDIRRAVLAQGDAVAALFDELRAGSLDAHGPGVTRDTYGAGEQFGYKWDINQLLEKQLIDYARVTLPAGGHLGGWADRGALLLNTCLTVEASSPASHAKYGWQALTDMIISTAANDRKPKVFMLWGAHAQAKAHLIDAAQAGHLVLQCNHPSPLAASVRALISR